MSTSRPAEALVIVPFPTLDEADQWAEKVRGDYPDEPPLVVTPGRETVVIDPASGETRFELCFEGGWRAKVADSHEGVVVITRTADATSASLSGKDGSDGHTRG